MANKILAIYSLLIVVLLPLPSWALNIEKIMPSGLLAHAEYNQGEKDKPAVLLLHGFLTVHTFSLIQNISNELLDNGITVLAPTLSLGISKRKTTLDCQALHLHNMEGDLAEVESWVNWLIDKGYNNIILIGHSSGALQIFHYANKYPHAEFSKVIGISLVPLQPVDQKNIAASIKLARAMTSNNDDGIQNFSLAYCVNDYASPAKNYLSYAVWDTKRTLENLRKLNINARIIMGSNDIPVYPGWVEDMRKTNIPVDIIPGANHFFSSGNEFELYEKLLAAINN